MTAPEKIYGWLGGQLSFARYSGGCKFNGHSYQIDHLDPDAPLVRADVFQAKGKKKTQKTQKASKKAQRAQEQLRLSL